MFIYNTVWLYGTFVITIIQHALSLDLYEDININRFYILEEKIDNVLLRAVYEDTYRAPIYSFLDKINYFD